MRKIKSVFCLTLIVVSMFSAAASAASFSFTFTNSGTDYSTLATKGNSRSFATVNVTTAGNYTYKYAVATGQYTGYKTSWNQKTGKGTFDINYTSTPSSGTRLRLHGGTVSSSGTSTVSGTWTP